MHTVQPRQSSSLRSITALKHSHLPTSTLVFKRLWVRLRPVNRQSCFDYTSTPNPLRGLRSFTDIKLPTKRWWSMDGRTQTLSIKQ